jgi:hypothetical protein
MTISSESVALVMLVVSVFPALNGCGLSKTDSQPYLLGLDGGLSAVPTKGIAFLPELRGAGLTVFVSESPLGGNEVAGADVNLIPIGGGAENRKVTDVEGVCYFDDIEAGEYALSVNHDAYPPNRGVVSFSGASRMVVILLDSDSTLMGRVFDADSDEPVKDFEVLLFGDGSTLSPRWRLGFVPFQTENGEFEAEGARSPSRIVVRASGYAICSLPIPETTWDERPVFEFPLVRSPIVIGEVVDDNGDPVSGVHIREVRRDGDMFLPEIETGADGSYRIENLAQTPAYFVATHSNFAPSRIEVPASTPGQEVHIQTVLDSGVEILGRVLVDGVAVATCPVELRIRGVNFERKIETNGQGEFLFSQIPRGAIQLRTELNPGNVPGLLHGEPNRIATRLIDGTSSSRIEETFDLSLEGGMVDGFITFADEPAIASVAIEYQEGDTQITLRNRTDDGGWYQMTGLAPGDYVVTIEAAEPSSIHYINVPGRSGGRQMQADTIRRFYALTIPESDYVQQDYDLRRGGTLAGSVDTRKDFAGVVIRVTYLETPSGLAVNAPLEVVRISPDGTFTLAQLPPGKYRVHSAVRGSRRDWEDAIVGTHQDFVIAGEEEVSVKLDLPTVPVPD